MQPVPLTHQIVHHFELLDGALELFWENVSQHCLVKRFVDRIASLSPSDGLFHLLHASGFSIGSPIKSASDVCCSAALLQIPSHRPGHDK
jgi:hypothetical protein